MTEGKMTVEEMTGDKMTEEEMTGDNCRRNYRR
jgi:hypothetical protein